MAIVAAVSAWAQVLVPVTVLGFCAMSFIMADKSLRLVLVATAIVGTVVGLFLSAVSSFQHRRDISWSVDKKGQAPCE